MKDVILSKSAMERILYLFSFRILLDFSYISVITKHYANPKNQFYLDFNPVKWLISLLLLFLIYLIINKKNYPSSKFLLFLYYINYLPLSSLYGLKDESTSYYFAVSICYFFIAIILRYGIPISISNKTIRKFNISKKMIFFISIVVYILLFTTVGLPSLKALNFRNIYDIRKNITLIFPLSYILLWQVKVINPYLLSIAILKKKHILSFMVLLLQLIVYLVNPHRAFFFSIPLVIFVAYFWKDKTYFNKFPLFLNVSIIISILSSIFTIEIISLFSRRFLFVPAQLQYTYYNFFSGNPKLFYSEGIIGRILNLKNPYSQRIANMIGTLYFDSPDLGANTGFLSDSYSNLGFLGMALTTILFIFILLLIDSFAKWIPQVVVLSTLIYPMYSLNDAGFLTTLSTHGLAFAIILLMIVKVEKISKIKVTGNAQK